MGFIRVVQAVCGTGKTTGGAHRVNAWVQISLGLTGRWTEGVKVNMLGSIMPR